MQDPNRLFDGFSKMASDAMGALGEMRSEMEKMARQQIERVMADGDFVGRDEFEAVRDMAAKARLRQEALETKVADLETRLEKAEKKKPPARKSTRAGRPSAKAAAKTAPVEASDAGD